MRAVFTGYRWVIEPDPATFDATLLGPPGTVWVFTEQEELAHAGDAGLITRAMLFLLRLRLVDGVGNYVVPERFGLMRWFRATVRGTMDAGSELLQHTLSLTSTTDGALTEDPAIQLNIANLVKDQWLAFLNASVAVSHPRNWMSAGTVYHDVTLQLLECTSAGGAIHQVGPTILSAPMTTGNSGASGGKTLPLEVACALTLRTRAQQTGGVSHGRRNRGRVYLGGFTDDLMDGGTDGKFDTTKATALAQAWGEQICVPIKAAAFGLEQSIVSRAGLIAHEVVAVQAGAVPDAQRRRRNAQLEAYATGWSIP